jgi:hypothetical protein
VSTWPFLRVSLPSDQPVRYLAVSFSSLSGRKLVRVTLESVKDLT